MGRITKSFSPFTLFADATTADAPDALTFGRLVDNLKTSGNDKKTIEELNYWLTKWERNALDLAEVAAVSPEIQEIMPMAINLSEMAKLSKVVLNDFLYKREPSPMVKQNLLKALEKSKESYGRTELAVVPHFESLLEHLNVKAN